MSRRSGTARRVLALLLGCAVLFLAVLLPAGSASAHPLDVYVQGSYLTLAPSKVAVELDLSPGVLLAPQVLRQLDADGDQTISDGEARDYAGRVVRQLQLRIDNRVLAISLAGVQTAPYLTVQAGYGTLRIRAEATGAPTDPGEHQVFFRNGFTPKGSAYQVNAFVAAGAAVTLEVQNRNENQQQSTIGYRITSAAGASPTGAAGGSPATVRPVVPGNQLLAYVGGPALSGWAALLALGAAALLGALHALTPGHAKTLMAAYLVGSGGTARNALSLGAVVTFTHTASVVVIGLIALLASQFLVPGLLVPGLEIAAGLLVAGLGLRLVRQRWSAGPAPASSPGPDELALVTSGAGAAHHDHHEPGHGHGHPAAASAHSHGGRAHAHEIPTGGITPRGLVAMGVSGGLVPCPEALGVMVLAVGVNRIGLGLALILAFSLGLAAVLMSLGLLLVRSRALLARFGRFDHRWARVLPLVSAVVVTALGLVLVLKGVGDTGLV